MNPQPIAVVTGASGFIGRPLVRGFVRGGFRVRALVRAPGKLKALLGDDAQYVDALAWTLDQSPPPDAFSDTPAALVHVAFETRGTPSHVLSTNVDGTRRLLDAANAQPAMFRVLVSSFSAGPPADAGLVRVSAYSRAKRHIEGMFDQARDLIVRPGLVLGPGDDGLFGRMRRQLALGVPVPLFYGGTAPVQWVDVDELVTVLVRGVAERRSGLYSIASPESVSLAEWIRAVARYGGVAGRTLRVPALVSDAAGLLVRAVERIGIRLPVTSDTIFGVKYACTVDTRRSLQQLGVSVAGLEDTLKRASQATPAQLPNERTG